MCCRRKSAVGTFIDRRVGGDLEGVSRGRVGASLHEPPTQVTQQNCYCEERTVVFCDRFSEPLTNNCNERVDRGSHVGETRSCDTFPAGAEQAVEEQQGR